MKRKILKFIAFFTVNLRMNIFRDARVSLIQYKSQKLIYGFTEIDTCIDKEKQELMKQNEILSKWKN
ncbi:hypothetical protein [Flavobacterium sp.]|uniref:hypothetical protein n=1 Tax=Flavobacterium sp. TaxID=239 RepID=UPI003750FBD6